MTNKDLLDISDEIICLSLEGSKDRRKLFEKRWGDLLKNKSFRYHLSRKPTINSLNNFFNNFSNSRLSKEAHPPGFLGRWGCWLSHYEILSSCKNRGVESVLILEDDTYPNHKIINNKINSPPLDWDVIYLGSSQKDILAEYKDKETMTETTYFNPSSFYNFGGWKKVRAWGTFGMIVKNTVYDHYLKELKDYACKDSSISTEPTADGTYYFYLWKKLSFYFNNELVLHDYSLESDIKCNEIKK